MCGWYVAGCCSPPPQRVFALPLLCHQPSLVTCYFACTAEQAACSSPHVAHAKPPCYRMISEDGGGLFICTHNKCYPNVTFCQQWMLFTISDAISKWMVFSGRKVRNQTERTQCDSLLILSLCDPRCLFRVFEKGSFFPSPHEFLKILK